jgi:hypothetical protein
MEADAFLTLFINKVDKVPATDGDYAELRDVRLADLNEVVNDFVQSYDFSFLIKTATLTVTSGTSSAELPTDFDNIGAKGGVWRTSDGEPLEYKDPDQLMAARLLPGNRPSLPEIYSFFGVSDTIDGGELIQTETLGASVTLRLLYKIAPPIVSDSGTGGLAAIPEGHQRGAIWAGMVAKKRNPESDFRNDPLYVAAKRAAISSDQKGKESGGQLASFFGD